MGRTWHKVIGEGGAPTRRAETYATNESPADRFSSLKNYNEIMPEMERKKTLTMNWDGLGDDDDDDRFFEAFERVSCASPADLASSSDDEDFEDSRLSFASTISSVHSEEFRAFSSRVAAPVFPDYDVWMAAPGSIKERRRRLLQGMGLSADKKLLSFTRKEMMHGASKKGIFIQNGNGHSSSSGNGDSPIAKSKTEPTHSSSPSVFPMLFVRSRSDGDIDSFSLSNRRKEELIGKISKQRLTRTYSMMTSTRGRICTYPDSVRISPKEAGRSVRHRGTLSSMLSSNRFGAFFLIKNLDTGKEFIVSEYDEDGMWNRFSDLQTGKQLTVEEFEKCVGYSPVVKELMRRENVSRIDENGSDRKIYGSSYLSKSLRMSKRRGAALLKNIKGSMSGLIGEKEREVHQVQEQKPPNKNTSSNSSSSQPSSEWIKVRQSGKSYKELSALHLCQEIQAHEGSIWTIKFSLNARFLASAGEDRIIHLWEVQECEVLSLKTNEEGSITPIHPYFCPSPDHSVSDDPSQMPTEKKKKGKGLSSSRKGNVIPDYVHVPEYVFSLSEKPFCSFKGHLDDVLDLSWSKSQLLLSSSMDKTVRLWDVESKSCLKLFAHNDYVTCIQFNPADDNYFISGSLDAKVRLWNIPDRHVVDWTDLHEMVTAACYTPDGQNALIGSHKGSCRMYGTEDCRLDQKTQIDVQNKKKSHAKKITGFQFSPTNPSEVLVTSADSRIRILDGSDTVHKFRGFKNASSQIAASFSQDGKYVISASEDSQVHVWKREEQRNPAIGKGKSIIVTRAHEHFECRDVSVAIPWPGVIKGEPPAIQIHSKRHSKRSPPQPPSASVSPSRDEFTSARRHLPPLPKKNLAPETNVGHQEEDLARVTRAESGIGESFSSASASMRFADSSSISSAAHPSSTSWSSSWSWFDGGNNGHGHHAVQATAWGLVIVTAGLDGEIRAYQNFGLPRRIGRHWTTA